MKSVGETFRQKREELNLSLKEVENVTSIRMNYLQAIEEGKMDSLLSPVYAQGFLKQYANYLGIDSDAIIRNHPEIFSKPEKQEFAYGIGTLEKRGTPGNSVKWMPNALWALLFLTFVIACWYFAKYLELF